MQPRTPSPACTTAFLFVRGHEHLRRAIVEVWASAYNERALAYRAARGIAVDEIAIGVLVQEMIDAAASGVMFTVNPNSGDVHEVVISSLFGAGEGLVSTGLEADTFHRRQGDAGGRRERRVEAGADDIRQHGRRWPGSRGGTR